MWFKNWRTEILIFTMMFLAGAAFYHPIEYDNSASRYALLSAVVDYGTLNIDASHNDTIDRAEWNGHYYSNKAPGASFLGIPVYWILRNLTPLKESRPMACLDMYIIRVVTTTLLFALLGVVMYRLAQFCGAFPRQAFLMVIAYGFGSIALLHATLFSGHQIAASLSFFSFALLVRSSSNDRKAWIENWGYGFLAGLLAGLAVITDYTAIVIAICLAMYVIPSRFNARLKAGFISGACVCVIILAAYNMACFGNPFSFSYQHLSHEKFREGASHGILGIGLPQAGAMIALLLSPSRGLFFIMPVLLLSFWGITYMIVRQKFQREAILISTVFIFSFLFVAGFYGWHGGWSFGPRYLVLILPFLAFPIAFLRWRPYLFWFLFIPSCAQVVFSVISVPHVPDVIANPIVELIIPCISYGYTALNAGMLLGLEWPWSAMIVIAFVGLLGIWVFHETGRNESSTIYEHISTLTVNVLVLLVVMIVAMLAVTRTDSSVEFRQLRSQVIEDFAIYFNKEGIAYGERNQNQLAIEEFNEAIRRKPAYAEAYNNRGYSHYKLGQYQRATQDYNKAISLEPDYAEAYMNRAVNYFKQNEKKQGCLDAQKACALGNCATLKSAQSIGFCR
ncbi:MAG: tetratricopeptide repeat protein [Smithella sp.]